MNNELQTSFINNLAPIIVALGGFVGTCGAVLLNCLSVKKHLREQGDKIDTHAQHSKIDREEIKGKIDVVQSALGINNGKLD